MGEGLYLSEIRAEHCREDLNEDGLFSDPQIFFRGQVLCILDSTDSKTAQITREHYCFTKAKYYDGASLLRSLGKNNKQKWSEEKHVKSLKESHLK